MHNTTLASPQQQKYRDYANASTDSILDTTLTLFGDDEFKGLPECWSDDVRMNALFAPFRTRALNPLHYDNKIKFWKELILTYCNEKQMIEFDVKLLEDKFKRKGVKPKCLELVIAELAKEKVLATREEIVKPKSNFVQNIFNKYVWSSVSWTASYFSRTNDQQSTTTITKAVDIQTVASSISDPNDSKFFVLVNLVETKSKELIKYLNEKHVVYQNVDCVIDYSDLLNLVLDNDECHASISDEKELMLVLRYLLANQKILIVDELIPNKRLIKFTSSYNNRCGPINEVELAYVKLKGLERRLESELATLNSQIESLVENQIKVYLKQNNKAMALRALRKKKELEKSFEKRESSLSNIQSMIQNIQQADTNQSIFDVYKESASAFKQVSKSLDLTKIESTIDDLQDAMALNSEIEEALKSPIGAIKFDEKELNAELNELLERSQKEEEESAMSVEPKKKLDFDDSKSAFNLDDLLNNLPQVPQTQDKKKSQLPSL